MKKCPINYSWPATLSDFSADEKQGNFTRGKLKVFYEGETADHRYFSKEFSEELVKSLPYTPVVSHYDSEKDDFVGHAAEQDIYGIVDPCVAPSFEKDEEDKTWVVCDVVLYTERPDKVGEIAKKIVGHKQSLELDPKTVKYTINYDERRHFKNLEFTAGTFIGVSVLGLDQKPAFTGSEFFAYNEDFEEKMQILKNYCEHKNDPETGGDQMNLQEFMKLSWGDISSKVDEALVKEYESEAFTMIIDMFEDSAIVRWLSYIDGSQKLMRVHYTIENGEVTLGKVNEVHITYEDFVEEVVKEEETGVEQAAETSELTESEMETVQAPAEVAAEEVSEETFKKEEPEEEEPEENPEDEDPEEDEDFKEEPKEEEKPEEEKSEEEPKEEPVEEDEEEKEEEKAHAACDTTIAETPDNVEAVSVENAEVTQATEKVSVDDENEQEESSSSTSFAESERAELEALKREKKITLLDSYKEILSEEQYNDFSMRIDESTFENLELELLKLYKEQAVNEKHERPFSFVGLKTKKETSDSLDNWVKNNL